MLKRCLTLVLCLIFSSNTLAAAPYQQQIELQTLTAQIDETSLKINCATCTGLTRQDGHTYFITYAAPDHRTDNYITFSYFYGDSQIFCKYDATVPFDLTKDGRFDASLFDGSTLNPSSTSKACPPNHGIIANPIKENVTRIFIDY